MGFTNDLLVDVNDALCRLQAIASIAQVVDSFKEDDPLDALLSQQIALVSVDGCRA